MNTDTPNGLDEILLQCTKLHKEGVYTGYAEAEAKAAIYDWIEREIIGEDIPNDGGEIVRNIHGEVKGRGAGSYMESCRRELRAEQRQRLNKARGDK